MSKPNMKFSPSGEEDQATRELHSQGDDMNGENDFDDAEQKLRQISNSFPEQPFVGFPLDEAEIDLILQAEDNGIEADLNNWLKNEDLTALDVDGSHHETITTTVIQDDYEVDRTRVLRIAMGGFFALFIMSLLGALLLFFDLQSQVDETRGSLRSLRTQLFGEHYVPTNRQDANPVLEPLLSADLSENQHSREEEVKALQQNLHVVTGKVSLLEKLLEELRVQKSDSGQSEALPGSDLVSVDQVAAVESTTGVARSKEWTVFLASFPRSAQSDRMYELFRRSGVAAERQQITIKGKQWHRLYVTGFKSKQAAATFADKASEVLGLQGVWVARLR